MREFKHLDFTRRKSGLETANLPPHLRGLNSNICRMMKIILTDQLKWTINDDGSPMTLDDEVAFCRQHNIALKKKHYDHLGIEAPPKKSKEAPAVTAEELDRLRKYLSEEEYEYYATKAAEQAADEEKEAA